MAEYQTLLVEKRGPVEWLTLNRPERLNTITGTMVRDLVHYLQRKLSDIETRVIVMRGAGRAFCAGLDIKERQEGGDTVEFHAGEPQLTDIVPLMRRVPQPIIALLHGAANGGGFAMALAADFRFAGESLKMNDAFARIGMSGCEMGVSYFLPRLVGLPVARELIYTGRFVDAERAVAIGLASASGPDDALAELAQPLIDDLLSVAPTGLRQSKRTLDAALAIDDIQTVIDLESRAQSLCQATGDFDEAMRAFLEKRPPRFATAAGRG
jgi:enoyl-CoA hydratase/carnithine racemase